jgi:hypothetical protein
MIKIPLKAKTLNLESKGIFIMIFLVNKGQIDICSNIKIINN